MRIIVIGGGFTGTLLASHLTQTAAFVAGRLKVTLIERTPNVGRGIAYSTPYLRHVLNVPAHNMSAWPDAPTDLVQWLQKDAQPNADLHPEEADFDLRHRFVERKHYGAYLGEILKQAEARGLERLQGEACSIRVERQGGAVVGLADGQKLSADKIALCLGHFPPKLPKFPGADSLRYPLYLGNPWQWGVLENVDPQAHVAIMGTGLTMVDVVLGLLEQGFKGKITAFSRHGLKPLPHVLGLAQKSIVALPPTHAASALVRALRRAAQARIKEGGDWRQSIDSLRHATPQIWQALSLAHQKQLLRHAKSFWDVHRHRIAPQVDAVLQDEHKAGRLRFLAGRIEQSQMEDGKLKLTIRPRKHPEPRELLRVDHLVNCTGGHNDWSRNPSPLVQDLMQQRLVEPDPHGAGIQANAFHAVVDASGRAAGVLWVAGPALVGRDFESIAVPELRQQAAKLAQRMTHKA